MGALAAAGRAGPVTVPFRHERVEILVDLDGDRKLDLIVPRQRRYEIYLQREDRFDAAAALAGEHRIKLDPGGPDLLHEIELEVEVPRLDHRDLNGDGKLDLVAHLPTERRFYLQGKDGFPAAPSYVLDLAQFRAGKAQPANQGPAEVKMLDQREVRVTEADLDGDGLTDYLVGAGRVVRLYFGSANGVDFSRPQLARRMSGELRGVGAYDVNRDGRQDLIAIKFDAPSIPRLVAAYFVSMTIEIEILAYFNRGGRSLSRRPDERRSLAVKLPPLRGVLESFDDIGERLFAAVARQARYLRADVDGDGIIDATFIDDDGTLRLYRGKKGERPPPERFELGDLLFYEGKSEWGLEELIDYIGGAAHAAARNTVEGRTPEFSVALGEEWNAQHKRMKLLDIDANGTADFVLEGTKEVKIVKR